MTNIPKTLGLATKAQHFYTLWLLLNLLNKSQFLPNGVSDLPQFDTLHNSPILAVILFSMPLVFQATPASLLFRNMLSHFLSQSFFLMFLLLGTAFYSLFTGLIPFHFSVLLLKLCSLWSFLGLLKIDGPSYRSFSLNFPMYWHTFFGVGRPWDVLIYIYFIYIYT